MTGNTESIKSPSPWTKPKMSGNGGNGCVNWRFLPNGGMQLTNDTDPEGKIVTLDKHEADCFLDAAANGEIVRPAGYEG